MTASIIYIIIGLALLVYGGDWLVKGSVAVAERAGLSHMVIGLTIVAFGTSAPELLVSLLSALQGNSGIALGNVVGSNIANIALILGATALLKAAPSTRQTIHVDMPFLLIASTLLIMVAQTGTIERWHGAIWLVMLIGFTAWQIYQSRSKKDAANDETDSDEQPSRVEAALKRYIILAVVVIVASLAALSYGADMLVDGATSIARQLGVSDRIIGLTIVAVGTSLPELFASLMAARRGETDMAIGNIIGSNLFNILCVLGLTSVICPIANANMGFTADYSWMFGLTALLWVFLITERRLSRWEGDVLLGLYVVYIATTTLFI